MNNYNIYPYLESIYNMTIMNDNIFEEIMQEYDLSISDFKQMKDNNDEQLRVTKIMNKIFFHKNDKNYHTITSKNDFSQLINKNESINSSISTLIYTPLNTHSRNKLSIGDILFSYRNGQFTNLNEALNTRGIYGVGIALTNPIKFSNQYESDSTNEYKDYGVIVAYPFSLGNHLSVKNIQLHPNTIDLTPYNGNRNDSLQYIDLPRHYNTLLGMIAYQNPKIIDFFKDLDMQVVPIETPDVFWEKVLLHSHRSYSTNNFKDAFTDWLLSPNSGVASKSASNYISGLNTLEKVWNKNNPDKELALWTNPYKLSIENILADEEVKKLSKKQNNTQSAALGHYFNFLEGLQVDSDSQIKDNTKIVSIGTNKIYFGAPGTGKSYGVRGFIKDNGIPNYDEKIDHPNVFRTTLHPEFTYSDFVGQIMPVVLNSENDTNHSRIEYKFSPQVFTQALKKAFEFENYEPVFLILEEMSRANVAAVFGDLFQLLDRDDSGESEYKINNESISKEIWGSNSIKKIYIPKNFFIIGTVNTNDQNVFVMDTAFKRRFEFDYVDANSIVKNNDGEYLNNFKFELKEQKDSLTISWIALYSSLNKFITTKIENGGLGLTEDKQVGQFFIKLKENDSKFNYNQLNGKLLQYLWYDIESTSYSENHLFKNSINNFSDAFTELSDRNNIFSKEFLKIMDSNIIENLLENKNLTE